MNEWNQNQCFFCSITLEITFDLIYNSNLIINNQKTMHLLFTLGWFLMLRVGALLYQQVKVFFRCSYNQRIPFFSPRPVLVVQSLGGHQVVVGVMRQDVFPTLSTLLLLLLPLRKSVWEHWWCFEVSAALPDSPKSPGGQQQTVWRGEIGTIENSHNKENIWEQSQHLEQSYLSFQVFILIRQTDKQFNAWRAFYSLIWWETIMVSFQFSNW